MSTFKILPNILEVDVMEKIINGKSYKVVEGEEFFLPYKNVGLVDAFGHCGVGRISAVITNITKLFGYEPTLDSIKKKLIEMCPDAEKNGGYINFINEFPPECAEIDSVAKQVLKDYETYEISVGDSNDG